jgi:hypothetical protein
LNGIGGVFGYSQMVPTATNFSTPAMRASSISRVPIIKLLKKNSPGTRMLMPMPPAAAARWMMTSGRASAMTCRHASRSTRLYWAERGTKISVTPRWRSLATRR